MAFNVWQNIKNWKERSCQEVKSLVFIKERGPWNSNALNQIFIVLYCIHSKPEVLPCVEYLLLTANSLTQLITNKRRALETQMFWNTPEYHVTLPWLIDVWSGGLPAASRQVRLENCLFLVDHSHLCSVLYLLNRCLIIQLINITSGHTCMLKRNSTFLFAVDCANWNFSCI